MISKLTRVRLLAILCGPLLGVITALALSLSQTATLRLLPNIDAAIWEPISHVLAWILITFVIAGLAAIYGAYDLLVMVTCVVPALMVFGLSYWADVSALREIKRHSMYLILGVISPFDFFGQGWFLFKLLAWALSAAAVGIAVKRFIFCAYGESTPAKLTTTESRGLKRGAAFDACILFALIVAVLGANVWYQVRVSPQSKLAELYHGAGK